MKLKSVILQTKNKFGHRNHINHVLVLRPTRSHCRGDSLNNPMLITTFLFLFLPQGHRAPCDEIGSIVSAEERPVGFKSGAFQFDSNTLNHWATLVLSCFRRVQKEANAMKSVRMLGYTYQVYQIKWLKKSRLIFTL